MGVMGGEVDMGKNLLHSKSMEGGIEHNMAQVPSAGDRSVTRFYRLWSIFCRIGICFYRLATAYCRVKLGFLPHLAAYGFFAAKRSKNSPQDTEGQSGGRKLCERIIGFYRIVSRFIRYYRTWKARIIAFSRFLSIQAFLTRKPRLTFTRKPGFAGFYLAFGRMGLK